MSLTLVSGAAGFIGSAIVKRLIEGGVPAHNIIAVDMSLDHFKDRECCAHFTSSGVRLLEFRSALEDLKAGRLLPHRIFHMGASSSTDEMREDYLDDVNFGYSRDLWQLAVQHSIVFVYASSAATYGAGEWGFSDDPARVSKLRPLNPYGWSKQKFDLYVLEQEALGLTPPHWAGLKFFNVYGPGEGHKGGQASVALHAYKQVKQSGTLKLFKSHKAGIADGEQKRDFVFIDDCVSVALACGALKGQGLKNGIYNVGSGSACSFLELGHAVFAAMGKAPAIEFIDTPERFREHYQYYTCADLARLRAAGFSKAMTPLKEGVARYISELSKHSSE